MDPRNKSSDFGDDPDLDPDPEIILRNFYCCRPISETAGNYLLRAASCMM